MKAILRTQVDRKSRLMTDEAVYYKSVGKEFAEHQAVNHGADEYVRADAHTNTLEGFYSVFKRGMKGVYQHCNEKHLKRYVTEFDFRYNERAALGVNDFCARREDHQGCGRQAVNLPKNLLFGKSTNSTWRSDVAAILALMRLFSSDRKG